MNAWYFKTQIPDELHGAKDYIKRAIEIRPMHAPWAKDLVEMSAAELDHATKLYKMFQEYYAKMQQEYPKEMPEYIEQAYKDVSDEFTKCSTEIKSLHEVYKM